MQGQEERFVLVYTTEYRDTARKTGTRKELMDFIRKEAIPLDDCLIMAGTIVKDFGNKTWN